jgi:hypothetical protein
VAVRAGGRELLTVASRPLLLASRSGDNRLPVHIWTDNRLLIARGEHLIP